MICDKEKAISSVINAAVEAWIAQDWRYAEHCFEMAEEFHRLIIPDALL
jgi:hypothetical protein